MGTVLVDGQAKMGLLGFALGLRSRGLLFVIVVFFVDQVCDQLVQSTRNSDPRERIVFVERFPLRIYLASNWL